MLCNPAEAISRQCVRSVTTADGKNHVWVERPIGGEVRSAHVAQPRLCSRCESPFQARFTRCAATSPFSGTRTSSHHCARQRDHPDQRLAEQPDQRGVVTAERELPAEDVLHVLAMSLSRLEQVPLALVEGSAARPDD